MNIRCKRQIFFLRRILLSSVVVSSVLFSSVCLLGSRSVFAQEAGEAREGEGTPQAQGGGDDSLFIIRRAVLAGLAAELAPRLGEGHLAILPPEVMDEKRVVVELATGWDTVMAEELGHLVKDLRLTERSALSAILREQKFGDSAYADPQTAVKVGKIAAARTLLLTRIHQFAFDGPAVRVHLEAKLLDVESGEILWARELRRGVLPPAVQLFLVVLGFGLFLPLALLAGRMVLHRRRRAMVEKRLPLALARARDATEKLERALVRSRGEFHGETSGSSAGTAVQEAFDALQPELLRVRTLPSGAAEMHRGRDLVAALGLASKIDGLVEALHQKVEASSGTGELVPALGDGLDRLRPMVDEYRRLFL